MVAYGFKCAGVHPLKVYEPQGRGGMYGEHPYIRNTIHWREVEFLTIFPLSKEWSWIRVRLRGKSVERALAVGADVSKAKRIVDLMRSLGGIVPRKCDPPKQVRVPEDFLSPRCPEGGGGCMWVSVLDGSTYEGCIESDLWGMLQKPITASKWSGAFAK